MRIDRDKISILIQTGDPAKRGYVPGLRDATLGAELVRLRRRSDLDLAVWQRFDGRAAVGVLGSDEFVRVRRVLRRDFDAIGSARRSWMHWHDRFELRVGRVAPRGDVGRMDNRLR